MYHNSEKESVKWSVLSLFILIRSGRIQGNTIKQTALNITKTHGIKS